MSIGLASLGSPVLIWDGGERVRGASERGWELLQREGLGACGSSAALGAIESGYTVGSVDESLCAFLTEVRERRKGVLAYFAEEARKGGEARLVERLRRLWEALS